jgi:FAD/FMN-containing dehydrogenase
MHRAFSQHERTYDSRLRVAADPPQVDGDEPVHPQILLEVDLRDCVRGGIRFDRETRARYSRDPRNYRLGPRGVVYPFTTEDAAATVEVCRQHDVPVIARTAGADGPDCVGAVVLDWSKYCGRLISVDKENHTAVVEPGITLADLDDRLAEHRLTLAKPDPDTVDRDVGAMIGDNALLPVVRWLEILTYDGARVWVGETSDARYSEVMDGGGRHAELLHGLREIRDRYDGDIRDRYPRIRERTLGYNLDFLLPERRFNVAGLLVGSGSSLAMVMRAELALSPLPAPDAVPRLPAGGAVPAEPDGMALEEVYGTRLVNAFGEVKDLFDPRHRMGRRGMAVRT